MILNVFQRSKLDIILQQRQIIVLQHLRAVPPAVVPHRFFHPCQFFLRQMRTARQTGEKVQRLRTAFFRLFLVNVPQEPIRFLIPVLCKRQRGFQNVFFLSHVNRYNPFFFSPSALQPQRLFRADAAFRLPGRQFLLTPSISCILRTSPSSASTTAVFWWV